MSANSSVIGTSRSNGSFKVDPLSRSYESSEHQKVPAVLVATDPVDPSFVNFA